MNALSVVRVGTLSLLAALLGACGGGGGGGGAPTPPPPTPTFTIGGTVSGLATGASLVLQNNAGSNLTVSANGAFTFANAISSGAAYAVTVLTQPSSPSQACTVGAGSGTASANVSSVTVTCTTSTFTVGGTIAGLAPGASVVLQNNGGANLTVAANGGFTFATPVSSGGAFAITVLTQPTSPVQTCTVSGGTGTIAASNVNSVMVNCATNTFTVGGTISGLASGATVVLQNNGGSNLSVTANGTYAFGTAVASGTAFGVTVLTQPNSPAQNCLVTGGVGAVAAANVTTVNVTCTSLYTIGGTVSGLASGATVVLQSTVGGNRSITANGAFAFPTAVASGTAYTVTVLTQPASPAQSCSVTGGVGAVATANVTSVAVTCTSLYAVGGTVSGLATGGTVVLQNNGGNNLTVSANGAFSFSTPVSSGGAYAVTALTQPTVPGPGQNCVVGSGSGNVASSNVTSVTVTCTNTDQAAPTLSARTPLPTTVGSRVQGGVVKVTFSEPILTSTVNTSSFSVQGPSGPVSGSISFANSNAEAIFTPTAPLAYDASYTVTVSTAVRDPSNNPLGASATWSFNSGKKIAGGFRHTCARLDDGRVKCWGNNAVGQLGYDDTTHRGDAVTPLIGTLAAVDLGTGRTAVAIAAGDYHNCAILDNGDTKCWGDNTDGALGIGSATPAVGDAGGEMATLLPLDFGGGRRAIEVALGQYFSCARLDDNSMKCWGRNTSGQLGIGNTTSVGDTPGSLASVATVSLGTGLTPITFSLGHYHACVLLENGSATRSVKCWGDNRWGQLGTGNTNVLGNQSNEMGDNLPAVSLGTGRVPTFMLASAGHSCAILDNGATKCWGLNTWGQVGLNVGNNAGAGSPADRLVCSGHPTDCVGDQPSEMGDNLTAAIAANSSRMTVGYRHSCVQLASGDLKCWGTNEFGHAGLGNNAGNNFDIGDQAGEIASLASTALKPATTVEELTAAGFHTCVWTAQDTLNCWGLNNFGQLGRNDTNDWGDNINEMGTNLADVNLGP